MRFSVDGTKYEFDEDRLTFGEARAIEKVTGMLFREASEALSRGDVTTLQAYIWVAMKRQEPTLTFSGIDDLAIGAIEFHEEDEPVTDPPVGDAAPTSTDVAET